MPLKSKNKSDNINHSSNKQAQGLVRTNKSLSPTKPFKYSKPSLFLQNQWLRRQLKRLKNQNACAQKDIDILEDENKDFRCSTEVLGGEINRLQMQFNKELSRSLNLNEDGSISILTEKSFAPETLTTPSEQFNDDERFPQHHNDSLDSKENDKPLMDLEELLNINAHLQGELSYHTHTIAMQKSQMASLTNNNSFLSNQNTALSQQNSFLNSHIIYLSQYITWINDHLKTLEQRLVSQHSIIGDLHSEIMHLDAHIQEQDIDYQKLSSHFATLFATKDHKAQQEQAPCVDPRYLAMNNK